MMKFILRVILYVGVFVLLFGGVGFAGYQNSYKHFWGSVYEGSFPSFEDISVPEHDPNKPTVAVMLGDSSTATEIFDFLIPYELFAMTEAYNVYAVASDEKVKSLTGGLEIVPHYTYEELDMLLEKSPDMIVVPYMEIVDEESYKPVREWIQKHADTSIISICGGSMNVADAGLLEGKTATSHWQISNALKHLFPETNWRYDRRYVDSGNIVTSGGQTGGFDAVLYAISQDLGEEMADKIAEQVKYPTYYFVKNPVVEPYAIDVKFATYVTNYAFHWNKTKAGVLLYNGMEEMALSSIFDTFADTGTTNIYTISNSDQPIVTKHHLNLVARYHSSNSPKLDRMIITGTEASTLAADDVHHWQQEGEAEELVYMHSNAPDRFVFSAPLEELAMQEDLLTAQHGIKRFEYRANDLTLEGKSFPIGTYLNMGLMTILSILAAYLVDRRFIMKKKTINGAKEVDWG